MFKRFMVASFALCDTGGSSTGNVRVNEYFVLPDGHGEVSCGAPQAVGAAGKQRDKMFMVERRRWKEKIR
jgi:hypothetical protein